MRISIRSKLTIIILILIMIAVTTLSLFSYYLSKKIVEDEIMTSSFKTLQNVENYFLDNFMSSMGYVVTYWADNSEMKGYKNQPGQAKTASTIPPQFMPIYNKWLGFIYSQPDIAWIYLGSESDGSIFIAPVDPTMPTNYDARTRDWYKGAVAADGQLYWSQPYLDAGSSGEVIVTVAKTVHNKNHLVGVVGMDIKLKKFSDIIRSIHYGDNNNGYLMLLNQDGVVYASPDDKLLNKNLSKEPWINGVMTTDSASKKLSIGGKDLIVSHLTVKNTQWKLVGVQEVDIKKALAPIRTKSIQIGFACLLTTLLLGYALANLFTRPIDQLVAVMGQVSKGSFGIRSKVRSGDEMETLSEHFNFMMERIQTLLMERDEHVRELEFKNFEIFQQREEISAFSQETEAMNEELINLLDEIRDNYLSTVTALANAIEASDRYTRGHCERVTKLSLLTAERMGMSQSHLLNLEFASILHDIGKIGIPTQLLNKEEPLTDGDFARICEHPTIGYEILKDVRFLKEASLIILQHHEHTNGNGYPKGLQGSEISLSASILSVADAYDAMTSSRPYRKEPLTTAAAFEQLIQGKGVQFDSAVVDLFIEVVCEVELYQIPETSSTT